MLDSALELATYIATTVFEILFNVQFALVMAMVVLFLIYDSLTKGWKQSFTKTMWSGSLASICIMVLNIVFIPIVYVTVSILQAGYDSLLIPRVPTELWSEVPFWIAGILAVMLRDFADYWNHRAMHVSWLWPIHAIHHSDEEVNGFTTFRIHFLEALFMKTSYVVIVSWAGFSPEAASFGAILFLLHNVYVHANIDWDHGPFKLLLASPRFHRWHHANEPAAFGKNLANVMPIWDYMFGTYYNPGACKGKMGADGVPHADVVALMIFPFAEWTKMIRATVSKKFRNRIKDQPVVEPAE